MEQLVIGVQQIFKLFRSGLLVWVGQIPSLKLILQ